MCDEEYERAFVKLKEYLSSPLIFLKHALGDDFYLYLTIFETAVSAVLVQEDLEGQKPVYRLKGFPRTRNKVSKDGEANFGTGHGSKKIEALF